MVTDGGARIALPNRDFDVLSFRANVVLRWEWRPGSTAYVVWQQNRAARDATGRLVRPSYLWDAFTAPGENIVAVKFSYWLPM